MKYTLLRLILLTTVTIGIPQADDLDKPWSMSEACVTRQPWDAQNREFDGTIIMTSRLSHLHAFRSQWETPRIVAKLPTILQPRGISPDARWYAVVEGMGFSNPDGWVTTVESSAIHVYNTLDGTSHTVLWEDRYLASNYPSRLFWIDNEHILYPLRKDVPSGIWYVINPFSGEINEWDGPFDPGFYQIVYLSPDATKGFVVAHPQLSRWTILSEGEEITSSGQTYYAAWHPSSEYLAILSYEEGENNSSTSVIMVNLEGEVEHRIYRKTNSAVSNGTVIELDTWSPNGRYLAFRHETLMIADLETKQVWDTCITVNSLAWSSDGEQLAVTTTTDENSLMRVIDIPTFDSRIIGIPSGPIIGWRADVEE